MQNIQQEPIAIIGMGCRFPQAHSPQEFWNLLREGKDAIREVPADRWDVKRLYDPDSTVPGKMVSRWGGFLDQVDQFDWRAFRLLPREATSMDPQHRLLLEVAWEALEDAGLPFEEVAGSRASVSIGIGWSDYLRFQTRNWSQMDEYTAMGSASGFAANRLSYVFDLTGPSVSVDSMCTSGLSAVYLACQSLWTGEASLALAGGVSLTLSPESMIMESKARLLSPQGCCKTLDAHADGYVRGEGAGIIILKPLSQVKESDRVYALLRGIAVNHNGHNEWIIASSQVAQEALLRDAYHKAGINPFEAGYVELNGTGFQRGDAVETKALGAVLGIARERTQSCFIGSVKTNIGHLEAASGIAGVIKVALSLYHGEIPPTLHLKSLNPDIPLDTLGMAVPQTCMPWPEKDERVAGVTTLAFTGANAHAVLSANPSMSDEICSEDDEDDQEIYRLLPLSARSEQALYELAQAYHDFLLDTPSCWRDICYSASVRRTHHRYRLAVAGRSPLEAAEALHLYLEEHARDLLPSVGTQFIAPTVPLSPSVVAPAVPAHLETFRMLYTSGHEIGWSRLYREEECKCVSLPLYSWQRERLWPDWLDVEEISTPPEERSANRCGVRDAREVEVAGRSIEEVLIDLWAEVLGLEDVSGASSFFELGGHSLLAMRLLVRIRGALQVEVTLKDLLEAHTPFACAALISQKQISQANGAVNRTQGRDKSGNGGRDQSGPYNSGNELPCIEPDPGRRYDSFPTTDVQQAYWVGRQAAFEIGNVGNHGYIEVDATDLDLDRFKHALQRLIERHDMLRAVLLPDGQQRVLAQVPPFPIKMVDLRGHDSQEQTRQLEQIRRTLDHQLLSVDLWPAFELWVSCLDERHVRLHLSIESLFVDAWSMNTLIHEFIRLYHEPDLSLPALALSFRDYVLAEASLQNSVLYQHSREYWNQRLSTLPPAPDLPLGEPPLGGIDQPRFVHREARLERVYWQRLKAHAAKIGLTPSGVLLTAFAEIIATWSKSARFSLNLSTFNRLPLHPEVNEIVGDFTSLVVLAVDHTIPDTFENRAKRVQEQLWNDLDHAYYSGIQLLRELAKMQGEGIKAIMPIVFTSLLIQDTASPFPPPWDNTIYCVSQTPQVWLDHQVLESRGDLVFHWQSVDAIFPAGLVDAMFGAYCQLLQRLASVEESWSEPVRHLLPEQRQVNATQAPVSNKLLHSLFLEQVAQRPDQLAVISADRVLPYKEVYLRVLQLAYHLRTRGAKPNQLVGVVMEKGWEQVVAVLAVLQSGAAYLPIDASLPKDRLGYILDHADVEVVLTQSRVDRVVEWPGDLIRICVDNFDLDEEDISGLESVQGPDDLAYVIYTSGSTGLPKGVMIDHRAAVNTILDVNERFNVNSSDRVFALSALNFDLSVYDIFGTLAAGGTIVVPPAGSLRDPATWLDLLIKEQVTIWNTVPALLQMLVDYVDVFPEVLEETSLRLALLSGDWVPLPLPDQLKAYIPDIQVISLGGATEAAIWSILYPIHAIDPSWKSIPYGKPMHNQSFFVLNEILEPCPVWVSGHLYIGGIGLARGYWRDEQKTQASFILHPQTGERLYRTGDLGRYVPDGNIEFLGREDFQVKVAGHRIELGEIEATLLDYPQVSKAVVTAIGKRFENKQLVAYVVSASMVPTPNSAHQAEDHEEPVDWETLVNHCQTRRQLLSEPIVDNTFLQVWQMVEQLSVQIVCKALNDFGVFSTSYERYSVDELVQHCSIHPRYTKWVRRNLAVLVQNGYVQEQNGVFMCKEPIPVITVDELWNMYHKAATGLTDPALLDLGWDGNIPLLPSQRIENLKAVLTEELHSAEIYVSYEMREVYRLLHYSNILMQTLVEEVISLAPPSKKIRILEIGAGFGITTTYLLPILPAERTEYVYTDISAYFLQEAQEKYAQYPFVEYGVLDIEKHPSAQGYEVHNFDIIIASSVLHATANMAETLLHVRSLLKPHGFFLLLEPTHFYPLFDLVMGLQQGIDRFDDTNLRQSHPLLSREMWHEVLREQGFASSVIFNKAGTLTDFLGIDVMLAQGPALAEPLRLMELHEHLRSKLPEYMIPSRIVPLEALPLTTNGKVDRHALSHLIMESREQARSAREARTPTEQTLVRLWCELLKLSNVGIEDNFLELGGDSLLATKLVARIRATFNVELPFQVLLKNLTIAAMADAIERYQVKQQATLLEQEKHAPDQLYLPFPTTDVQQAYWIGRSVSFELGNVGNHVYVEVEAVDLDLTRSQLILRRLIERHPMLRAIMLPDGQQKILEHVPPFQVEFIDLEGLDEQEVAEHLAQIRYEMDHQVFQVERWPAFEIHVSRLQKRRVRIHVSIEALFIDGWCLDILVREFLEMYHRPEVSLPSLDLSFRDYVLAEGQMQASELYRHSQDYWTQRLRDLPPGPDLPLAIEPASLKHPRFVSRKAQLEASAWQQLKVRGTQAGLTPSGILLAAFAEVLTAWSKTTRFCINVSVSQRLPLHEQVNEIVGDFTSLLLLAVDHTLPATFEQRAKGLQEQLWCDFEHRYYSGVRVLRDLARVQGNTTQAIMPVIFTSLLGRKTATAHPAPWGEPIYFISQSPQVWLDHLVLEEAGNLVLYWQAVEALFPPGLLDAMFEAYIHFLHRLTTDEEIWQSSSCELVPSSQLEALPLTVNGKVDRHVLPRPIIQSRRHASSSVATRTPTEETLVQLWSEVLKLSNIGIEDNFYELGGDSLLVIKLIARIRATFNREVPLGVIFENLTIAGMAEAIDMVVRK